MNTQKEQSNIYTILTSSGKESKIYILASNLKDAYRIAKEKYPNQLYFGKLTRCYNGGVRG